MYGQIISFLFLILILYYAVMIFLDIQKAKAAKAAEHEKNNEEEIDISDEASTFKPVMITRDEPIKNNSESDSIENDKENRTDNEGQLDKSNKPEPDTTQSDKPKSDKPKSEHPVQEKKPETEKTDRPNPEVSHEEKPESELVKSSSDEDTSEDVTQKSSDKPFRRPGYREAIMTGYISVDYLIDEANRLAETGEWDLGNVIHTCDNAA
ncbi:hypothetical protein [uncultured Duncaniella sp.]|uniref:hypothetical protein n=1 Tax=uncultured Duncaniella sp. TaxID=2768039 RepID=UPI0025A9E906|nr:hypothetical protein [uncultured Duncaniella sp.]